MNADGNAHIGESRLFTVLVVPTVPDLATSSGVAPSRAMFLSLASV